MSMNVYDDGTMRQEWEIETGVTCVVCPGCAFTFDACHTNTTSEGGYTCPCCGFPEATPYNSQT